MEIRPISAAELEPFLWTTESAFHEDVHHEDLELFSELIEPERTLAAFDGDADGCDDRDLHARADRSRAP